MCCQDEAIVVPDKEGAKAAESTMPEKVAGGHIVHDNDLERDLAWVPAQHAQQPWWQQQQQQQQQ
jgi:hypothetical protein